MEFSHTTVLLDETVGMLDFSRDGVYVDMTAGGGGHSALIASKMSKGSRLICFDKDGEAVDVCKRRFENDKRVEVVRTDFKNAATVLLDLGISEIDGAIADLGVSSYQLDNDARGFSYMHDAPLDMRMDESAALTAYDIVNGRSEEELKRILYIYGEEDFAPRIAAAICKRREESPIRSTAELSEIIKSAIPAKARVGGHHPAKRSFQAIRIAVNKELDRLPVMLEKVIGRLKPGGVLAVISFHSLEDRIVKNTFADQARGCTCPPSFPVCVCGNKEKVKIITKKPVLPTEAELEINPRSRSAKLRACRKI